MNQPFFPIESILSTKSNNYINTSERSTRHHDIYLDGEITEPANYRELISLLFNACEDDTILIFINSTGGQLDTATAIVEGLKATGAHVTGIIVGACHSAASIISMYCHDVIVTDNAYSMVHTASFGSSGSAGNVKAHTEFTVRQVEKLLNDTYEGFLTKDELTKIKAGVEMWFDAEEIKSRMHNRIKYINSKRKKQQATDTNPNTGTK